VLLPFPKFRVRAAGHTMLDAFRIPPVGILAVGAYSPLIIVFRFFFIGCGNRRGCAFRRGYGFRWRQQHLEDDTSRVLIRVSVIFPHTTHVAPAADVLDREPNLRNACPTSSCERRQPHLTARGTEAVGQPPEPQEDGLLDGSHGRKDVVKDVVRELQIAPFARGFRRGCGKHRGCYLEGRRG
jgi:hypothetical protein